GEMALSVSNVSFPPFRAWICKRRNDRQARCAQTRLLHSTQKSPDRDLVAVPGKSVAGLVREALYAHVESQPGSGGQAHLEKFAIDIHCLVDQYGSRPVEEIGLNGICVRAALVLDHLELVLAKCARLNDDVTLFERT